MVQQRFAGKSWSGWLFLFIFFFPVGVGSRIITDGTLGPAVTVDGPDYEIGQELGTRLDTNLFHSFHKFDIHAGECAIFTGSDDITSVISRVTGGDSSTINGLLSSRIGLADFYFINPAGVVLGPDVQVDVPAAFHIGTADELRFADGAIFSATRPDASVLSSVSPEHFGYLVSHANEMELTADLVLNRCTLEFDAASSVSLSGRHVAITGEETANTNIRLPGGNLRISATGDGASEISFTALPVPEAGKLDIENATIVTRGDGGGELLLSAGDAAITNSILAADNVGSTDALGNVQIAVAESLNLNSSCVQSNGFGSGTSGRIMITAGDLMIRQPSTETVAGIFSDTTGEGNAGGITIEVENLLVDGQNHGAGITSNTYGFEGKGGILSMEVSGQLMLVNGGEILSGTSGKGDGGPILIKAGNVLIDGQESDYITGITSSAWPGSGGNAGSVTMDVAGQVELVDGGEISSDTWDKGHAGSIVIEAGNILIDGQESDYITGITSSAWPGSGGNAGSVTMDVAGQVELVDGGEISSDTWDKGHAGSIIIEAENLCLIGNYDESGYLSSITSNACPGSSGEGGSIRIRIFELLDIIRGGTIAASTYGEGNGGDIHIHAGKVNIESQKTRYATGIISNTFTGSGGNGGAVSMFVEDMLEITQGIIATDTSGSGSAGMITVDANQIRIVGYGDVETVFDEPVATPSVGGWLSGIFNGAESDSGGQAGAITIIADTMEMWEGGSVTNRVWSTLVPEQLSMIEPQTLSVSASTLRLNSGSWISTGAFGNTPGYTLNLSADTIGICDSSILTAADNADGGSIQVNGDLVALDNSLITSSVASEGDGGDITVTGKDSTSALILKGGFIQANAPPGSRGGDILIHMDMLMPEGGHLQAGGQNRRDFQAGSGKNIIQAAAPGGEQGRIEITSPDLDITGAIMDLNTVWVKPVHLRTDPCLDTDFSSRSTLIHSGQGGIPPDPEQPSTIFFDDRRLKEILMVPEKEP
jgi:filamentous hemagglutinin family protein